MRKLATLSMLTSALALAGCAQNPPAAPVTTVASSGPCGTGYVDVNNDGWITGDEWGTYRSTAYGAWDLDRDGRVDRAEFERCYRAGGFYKPPNYNPDYWTNYFAIFDANADGYLSSDEYWSAGAWTRIDRNANGRIDPEEWTWWSM